VLTIQYTFKNFVLEVKDFRLGLNIINLIINTIQSHYGLYAL
jgi:hypothetical protein